MKIVKQMIDWDSASWGAKVPDQTCELSPVGSGSRPEVEPEISGVGSGLAVGWTLSLLGVLKLNKMKWELRNA